MFRPGPAGHVPGLGPAEKPDRVRSGPDPPEFNLELHWGVVKGADSAATHRMHRHRSHGHFFMPSLLMGPFLVDDVKHSEHISP